MRTICLALTVVLFGTPKAFAQRQQPAETQAPLFVSGGVVADGDHTWGNVAGVVGFSASAGLDVSRHAGVRVVIDVPKMVTVTCGGGCFERHRSLSWSALIDLHGQVSDRVRIGVITGITSASHYSDFAASTNVFLGGSTFTWWGVTAGVELPVSLTSHLSVVPDARVIGFPLADYGRTAIFRPGVSLRWRI